MTLLSWWGRRALLSARGWKTLLCSRPDARTGLLGHSLRLDYYCSVLEEWLPSLSIEWQQQCIYGLCFCWETNKVKSWLRNTLNCALSGGSNDKVSARNARDPGSIPGLGRSPGEGKWQSTPALFPGKSHGQRILIGYSPWGCKESNTTEWLHFHFSLNQGHNSHIRKKSSS